MPRYPDAHVQLRSRNPFALVSGVRLALRQLGVSDSEIFSFTEQALESRDPERMREICSRWATISIASAP